MDILHATCYDETEKQTKILEDECNGGGGGGGGGLVSLHALMDLF